MSKKNEIICSPKSNREMYAMTAAIVYVEHAVRFQLHKHKEISLIDVANQFLKDVLKIENQDWY